MTTGHAGAVATDRLTGLDRAGVLSLVAAAAAEDRVAPLSEQTMLHVRHGVAASGAVVHLVLADGGNVTGYAHMETARSTVAGDGYVVAEAVVHPAARRQGRGKELLAAARRLTGDRPLRVWAHGDLPAAAAFARAAGFRRVRTLWRMHRSLSGELEQPGYPEDVVVRTFVPGRDDQRWLELNARVFAGHPEQGAWTATDLTVRVGEPWFDAGGFFLAERDGRLVGFHWTKIHSAVGDADTSDRGGGNRPLGEVYVIGVAPGERGTGLGRALTLTGLRYLRDRGAGAAILYVDESNEPAVRLYTSLGFTRQWADVMYEDAAGWEAAGG